MRIFARLSTFLYGLGVRQDRLTLVDTHFSVHVCRSAYGDNGNAAGLGYLDVGLDWPHSAPISYTVNVDCVKFKYVVLAKYHQMIIFEFDLLTKQHILILCKKLL